MALKHGRSRADERGAALFIVVLIVVLLGAVGAFAAHATSLTQAAAGYSRRAASSFYLAEYGLNVVSAAMSGKEDTYDMAANSLKFDCRANLGRTGTTKANCYPLEFSAIKSDMLDDPVRTDPDGVFGSLSRVDRPADQAIRGSIRVEMTDVGDAPEAIVGQALNGPVPFTVRRAALTTTSVLMPTVAGARDCDDDVTRASETTSIRGWLVYSMSSQAKSQNGVQ